jgi:UDP-N-acetylmuramate dehydrogenase
VRVERDYSLAGLTTFGVGGPADYVAFCSSPEDVVSAIEYCRDNEIEYFVLGGGSNVLVSDSGFRGMIILIQDERHRIEGERFECGAGLLLHRAVELTTEAGLAGFECLAGIAGTIGGAIAGNAGAYGAAISDRLINADVYDPERGVYVCPRNEITFRYRYSDLKGSGKVILSGSFQLSRGEVDTLRQKVEDILEERWRKLPRENISAGCFFRNIEKADAPHGKLAAGYLLEQIGAKQMRYGKAGVSADHANVLINNGGASASEILGLSRQLKDKVRQAFGIDLVEEVVLIGDFS